MRYWREESGLEDVRWYWNEEKIVARRRRCLDDLCLDDTQNLPDLSTNWGDDHGNFVEEITSITCASQVRECL
jgi:hypothetical protein